MNNTIRHHRLYGVDIVRIVCALLIFMRHSITMYGCSYGSATADNLIISLTSPVMSMFFILSGFSINYGNLGKPEWDYLKVKQFYAKRLVQILPTYLLIHCLWLILGGDSFIRWAFLTPLELSVMQAMYPNIFGILHNGGTWFISCLLMAYVLYPVIRALLLGLGKKTVYCVTAVTVLLLIYLPVAGSYYALGQVYSNPVYRCLEFALGVLISYSAYHISTSADFEKNGNLTAIVATAVSLLLFALFSYFLINGSAIGHGKLVLALSSLCLYPFIMFTLCASFISRCPWLENNKVIKYLSGLVYYFFILQLFLWKISDAVIKGLRGISGADLSSNISKLTISFTICLLLSVILFEFFDKPIKRFCFNRFSIFSRKSSH